MCPAEEDEITKIFQWEFIINLKKVRHILSKDNLILFMEVRPSDEHKLGYDV
jgi:hypothetical protein